MNQPTISRAHDRLFLYLLLGLIVANVLAVLYSAHWLRPGADDYCLAWVTAERGVIGSVISSWESINGYLTSVFYGSLWVGWPLAHLPLSLASALPFILTAVGIGFAVNVLLSSVVQLKKFAYCIVLVVAAYLWWSFFWVPTLFSLSGAGTTSSISNSMLQMGSGLAHWQTLNGQHVLQMCSLIIFGGLILRHSAQHSNVRLLLIIGFGFIAGMMGPTLAVSLIVFAVLAGWVFAKKDYTFSRAELMAFIVSILVGLIFTQFFSPGIHKRQALLGTKFDLTFMGGIDLLDEAFRFALQYWLNGYLSYGGVTIFLVVVGLVYVLGLKLRFGGQDRAWLFGALFGLFSLLQMLINRAAETFAYHGYWHFISAIVCTYISIVFLGIAAGIKLETIDMGKKLKPYVFFVLLLGVLLGISSNIAMMKSMYARQTIWSGGPASVLGVTDIDIKWVDNCWDHLNTLRPHQIER